MHLSKNDSKHFNYMKNIPSNFKWNVRVHNEWNFFPIMLSKCEQIKSD